MTFNYPFDGDEVTFTQANKFIAEVLWHAGTIPGGYSERFDTPGAIKEAIRKQVRLRIRRAQEDKRLPAGDGFKASSFFRWAVDVDQAWRRALLEVEGLPIAPLVEGRVGCLDATVSMTSGAYFRPGNESDRDEFLLQCQMELEQARADQAELAEYRRKEQRIKQQNRENAAKRKKRAP